MSFKTIHTKPFWPSLVSYKPSSPYHKNIHTVIVNFNEFKIKNLVLIASVPDLCILFTFTANKFLNIYLYIKPGTPGGCLPRPREYIDVYDYLFQTYVSRKQRLAIQSQAVRGTSIVVGTSFYFGNLRRMAKITAMPIYGKMKTSKIFFSRNQMTYYLETSIYFLVCSIGNYVLYSV